MDTLYDRLVALGHDQDVAHAVCERAAIMEHDGGLSRWRAGVAAQREVLGNAVCTGSDI